MPNFILDGGDFAARMEELRTKIGADLKAEIAVDQVYAHYQDDGVGPMGKPAAEFNHPRGGKAGYLSDQTTVRGVEVAEAWAAGVTAEEPMSAVTIRKAESFAAQATRDAPQEFEILKQSVSVKVFQGDAQIYFRPALIPRLSEDEIKALRNPGGDEEGSHLNDPDLMQERP